MNTASLVSCIDFPCLDTLRAGYLVPDVEIDPAKISILLISEAAPTNPEDYQNGKAPVSFAAGPQFPRKIVAAFRAPASCTPAPEFRPFATIAGSLKLHGSRVHPHA